MTYDYDNRPTSITANGNAVANVYDASGNRVRKMKSSPNREEKRKRGKEKRKGVERKEERGRTLTLDGFTAK